LALRPVWERASRSVSYSDEAPNKSSPKLANLQRSPKQKLSQTGQLQCFQTAALPGPIFSMIDGDIPQGGFYDLHGADIAHPDPIIKAETLPASNQLAAILVKV